MQKVSDIMTAEVISVRPSDTIAQAIQLMLQNRISGLPVIDDAGELCGIVSEGDLLRRAETSTARRRARWLELLLPPGRLADEYVHTHGRRIDEVMTDKVATVTEDVAVETVVTMMEQSGIKRVPVVRGGKVVGIVTRANLLQALAAFGETMSGSTGSDATIRRRILDEVAREPWGPRYGFNVIVHDGKVDLWGAFFDERERKALRVVVENIPGVKEIHDHMILVEPRSGAVLSVPDESRSADA
jgi:CBS domain-containing protein